VRRRRHITITAKFVQILEYMDGPQAVLLERSPDSKIVAIYVPGSDQVFFGSEISYEQWERYRRGLADLKYLFMYPKWKRWYTFSLHNLRNGDVDLLPTGKTPAIEETVIPDTGFFSYDHSEPIQEGKNRALATQKYATDGIWDLPDFSKFYKKLIDIYTFLLSVKKYTEDATPVHLKKRIRDSFTEQPLRGGSSYNNMYGGLLSVQQLEDRLSVGRLYYGSPGEVDVRGRHDIFTEIAISISTFENEYEQLKIKYDDLYDYLSKGKLLKRAPDRFDKTGSVAEYLLRQSRSFAKALNVENAELIYQLTGSNSLVFTKVLLSHFRRLEKYFMFFAEGRVKEPVTIQGQASPQ
jgi:hypothetical protein